MYRERPLIFLTVGTQRRFDRLVFGFNAVAPMLHDRGFELFGQILETQTENLHFPTVTLLRNKEISEFFDRAFIVVSHCGMGTILNCQMLGKYGFFMPRKAALSEHVNDHQVATADAFRGREGIEIVNDAEELVAAFDNVHPSTPLNFPPMSPTAGDAFLGDLQRLIEA